MRNRRGSTECTVTWDEQRVGSERDEIGPLLLCCYHPHYHGLLYLSTQRRLPFQLFPGISSSSSSFSSFSSFPPYSAPNNPNRPASQHSQSNALVRIFNQRNSTLFFTKSGRVKSSSFVGSAEKGKSWDKRERLPSCAARCQRLPRQP